MMITNDEVWVWQSSSMTTRWIVEKNAIHLALHLRALIMSIDLMCKSKEKITEAVDMQIIIAVGSL